MPARWMHRAVVLALCLLLVVAGGGGAKRAECEPVDGAGDPTAIDTSVLPDYWDATSPDKGSAWPIDARIPTNAADQPPDQLIKVTNRRHRHPVFATMCSIAFLLAIVLFIVVCSQS